MNIKVDDLIAYLEEYQGQDLDLKFGVNGNWYDYSHMRLAMNRQAIVLYPYLVENDGDTITCGECGKTWNDNEIQTHGPRCPYEYEHDNEEL